jgi:hypothetical protein
MIVGNFLEFYFFFFCRFFFLGQKQNEEFVLEYSFCRIWFFLPKWRESASSFGNNVIL